MRNEIKTAMITVIVVVALVGGIGYYFTTLDKQKEMLNSASDSKQGSTGTTKTISQVDESQFPIAPDLVGISGYVNTTPDQLKASMKDKVVLYDFGHIAA